MFAISGMDVPADILVPPEAYGRSFSPHDAALVLDGWLRRLAAHEARCRMVLGTLAERFLARRGCHELGFARLGDYTREQLGLSARELQSLATVSARLARLPHLRDAFTAGILGWAQLRLLATVATPETEAEWLEVARGRTVRALAAVIRPSGAGHEDDDGDAARFRLRCPRRIRRLWQHVVELARRMAGSEITHGQAAEAIAAEGLSARSAGEDAWPGLQPIEPDPPESADPAETRAAFADLDWSAVQAALPEDITGFALDLDGLDPFTLDARMREVLLAMRRIDWQLGRLLRVFLDRRLYRLMGFPSAGRYLTERLGISAGKARALVALERKTWQADAFGTAYRAGDISWVRALTILPVVAEPTAQAWVARATAVPVRRLADEVEWALTVRDGVTAIAPPPAGASLDIGERQMCARPEWEFADAEIAFSAPTSVVAPSPDGDPRLRASARLARRRSGVSSPAREGRVGGPAAPPRPGLRARRLALYGSRLHGPAKSPRPPSRVSIARGRQRPREPPHALRLASSPRRSCRAHTGRGRSTRCRHLGDRRASRPAAAASPDRRTLCLTCGPAGSAPVGHRPRFQVDAPRPRRYRAAPLQLDDRGGGGRGDVLRPSASAHAVLAARRRQQDQGADPVGEGRGHARVRDHRPRQHVRRGAVLARGVAGGRAADHRLRDVRGAAEPAREGGAGSTTTRRAATTT